ncbi:hypothetical protein PS15m_000504 [Mucor circinelloides]
MLAFAHSAPDLLCQFNVFRTAAIERLKVSSKLDSYEQALSLNGIILLASEQHNEYNAGKEVWGDVVQEYKALYIGNHQFNEEAAVSEIIQDFYLACKQNINLSDALIPDVMEYATGLQLKMHNISYCLV